MQLKGKVLLKNNIYVGGTLIYKVCCRITFRVYQIESGLNGSKKTFCTRTKILRKSKIFFHFGGVEPKVSLTEGALDFTLE